MPIRYHASQGVLFSIYIFVVESTVKRNSLFHIQQFFAIYLMYIHIYIALQSPENLYMIFAIDENISQYYFQIAKIDIVLQSSEFCMIFWDEFKRHLVRKCSIFPAAQSPKLWLKTLCYISRAKLLLKLALVFIIRSTFLTNHLYYRLLSLANEFIITVTLFQIQFDSKSLSIH